MFPDISEYQGTVDWNALEAAYKAGTIEAVGMRASFGTVRADHQFAINQQQCRARGIPAIYYHFCYPTFNAPQAEAAFFNGVVGPLHANEAMVGDFEDDPASNSTFPRGQAGVDWAKAFLTALESPQNATWWYTYPFLLTVIPFSQLYGTWPFWLADYSAAADSAFTIPIARQFTSIGATPGVSGNCDQSRVLKSPLSQWLTGGTKPMTRDDWAAITGSFIVTFVSDPPGAKSGATDPVAGGPYYWDYYWADQVLANPRAGIRAFLDWLKSSAKVPIPLTPASGVAAHHHLPASATVVLSNSGDVVAGA